MEALVAVGLLATAAVALASLASVAIRANMLARERTLAALYAARKMEVLSRAPATLVPSPPDALTRDAPGCIDYLEAGGRLAAPGRGVRFVRRWAVTPLPQDPGLLRLTVDVTPCRSAACLDPLGRVRLRTMRSTSVW